MDRGAWRAVEESPELTWEMRLVNSRCFSGLGTRGQAENRSVFCHQLLPLVLTQGPLPWLRSWEEQKGTMATVPDRNPSEPLPVSKGTCAGAPNQDRALVLQCQCLQSACDPVPVSFTSCLPGRSHGSPMQREVPVLFCGPHSPWASLVPQQ